MGGAKIRLYRMIFNPTGGMEKVTDTLSCGWDYEQETVDLLEVDQDYGVYKLKADDACIVAVPSSGGRVPAVALERLPSMKGNQARAVLAAVYNNRDFKDTLLELKGTLEAAGFRCMVAVAAIAEHSIMHQFAAGRPDEKNVAQLKTFAEQIREKLEGDKAQEPTFVPRNRPYRKYSGIPLRPKTDETCRRCGAYVRKCPVHAIPEGGMIKTDGDMYISYMRCIAVYPSGSRRLSKVMVDVAVQKLKKACAGLKQNELFL